MKKQKANVLDNDDVPELDESWFNRSRPAADVLPDILGKNAAAELLNRKPGQRGEQISPKKERITIRLQSDILEFFRSTGPGWQTRIDTALKEWVNEHRI
jgi:uncharacterized protein (DUF4415 family)